MLVRYIFLKDYGCPWAFCGESGTSIRVVCSLQAHCKGRSEET